MSDYWGPRLWYLLHTFSIRMPLTVDNRHLWGHFLKACLANMNCRKCQIHFSEELRSRNIGIISKEELETWFFQLHNDINRDNLKPIFTEEEWTAFKSQPFNKEKIVTTVDELSAYFLKNEQVTHLNAGSSRIWRGLALRMIIGL
jgi:Erv1 / Alr family